MKKNTFGTAPVFFTAISTILGAIMFLRFGFSVGTLGFVGTVAIVLIGHAVTIPTAMAIAEIATNQRVEGGGEYYIISRSFGLVIGAAIGIALYFSQAISIAFYIMAFSEAFTPLVAWAHEQFALPGWLSWLISQKQTVGIPALFLLTGVMLTKGADLGVKLLYAVVATLALVLIAFFIGNTEYASDNSFEPFNTVYDIAISTDSAQTVNNNFASLAPDSSIQLSDGNDVSIRSTEDKSSNNPVIPISFFMVFAIIFPAFTGMTAGVGLSGDLKDPGRSIPLGTLSATIVGMVIYIFMAYKLTLSASPVDLANTDELVMSKIAWQGWLLIPIGLAAATISSALGSIMVAPRTLQAIARDRVLPSHKINAWLGHGNGQKGEPYNASIITVLIGLFFIMLGAIDSVAEIISMFFMVTYGSLCLISFLQHFAADPSYRPKFRSRWYISLFGAIACFGLMFFMNALYAVIAIVLMLGLYFLLSTLNPEKRTLAVIFQGVTFQLSRQLQVFLQKAEKEKTVSWRPSAICLSENTFERLSAFQLLKWLSQRYGFGTYIHLINGYLSRQSGSLAKNCKARLIEMAESSESNVYMDTLVSPSYTSSIAQVIQVPGIAGTENNLLILEFSKTKTEDLSHIVDNMKLIQSVDFDLVILGSSERGYGLMKEVHIWLTAADYDNANLMILLAYIIVGHKDWKDAEIKISAIYPEESLRDERSRLMGLIQAGQLPISPKNIKFLTNKPDEPNRDVISQRSRDADLVILGFRAEAVKQKGADVFSGYERIGNVLFVNASEGKNIK